MDHTRSPLTFTTPNEALRELLSPSGSEPGICAPRAAVRRRGLA